MCKRFQYYSTDNNLISKPEVECCGRIIRIISGEVTWGGNYMGVIIGS